MDFFDKTGVLAISSRLRRLTEQLTQQNIEIYAMYGADFKPKWFPVFMTLSDGQFHAVTEIAKEIGQTHPSVCTILREMAAKGLTEERKGKDDARRNEVRLSKKGKARAGQMTAQWQDVEQAAKSLCGESSTDLWNAIGEWEYLLAKKSLTERVREIRAERINHRISIIPYNSANREDFVRLSRLWITSFAEVEPCDEEIFADPYAACVAPGGEIFVAWDQDNEAVAGICALLCHKQEGYWELSKLCVDPAYRGQGIGDRLIDAVADLARERGASQLYLDTASPLVPAIRLYRKKGFVEIPLGESHYKRADLKMVKELS